MVSKLASATALAVLTLGVGTASGYRLGTGAWPDTTELRQKLAALAGQAVTKSAPVRTRRTITATGSAAVLA